MKHLSKVVLGLATVTMLASCSKDITRAEALEIVKGYEAAAVVYKSGEMKVSVKYTFSDSVPEIIKSEMKDQETTQTIDSAMTENYRLSEAAFLMIPEAATFKADGKQLEVSYKSEETSEGMKVAIDAWEKINADGYPVEEKTITTMSADAYSITINASVTATWTK